MASPSEGSSARSRRRSWGFDARKVASALLAEGRGLGDPVTVGRSRSQTMRIALTLASKVTICTNSGALVARCLGSAASRAPSQMPDRLTWPVPSPGLGLPIRRVSVSLLQVANSKRFLPEFCNVSQGRGGTGRTGHAPAASLTLDVGKLRPGEGRWIVQDHFVSGGATGTQSQTFERGRNLSPSERRRRLPPLEPWPQSTGPGSQGALAGWATTASSTDLAA